MPRLATLVGPLVFEMFLRNKKYRMSGTVWRKARMREHRFSARIISMSARATYLTIGVTYNFQ